MSRVGCGMMVRCFSCRGTRFVLGDGDQAFVGERNTGGRAAAGADSP